MKKDLGDVDSVDVEVIRMAAVSPPLTGQRKEDGVLGR